MDYLHAIVMGIIQGLTEFLPVSSSAHLALYPKIFNVSSALLNSVSYDVALHAGTLLALLIFFRKKVLELLGAFFKGLAGAKARQTQDFKLGILIIAGTIPAVLAGYFLGDYLESAFRSPVKMASMLIIFGGVLWLADRAGKKRKEMAGMNLIDSLIVGFAQALALIPGVSRSGITISAGLFAGYKRKDAAEFSFLLSIPAVAGAFAMQAKHLLKSGTDEKVVLILLGFTASVIAGMLAIKFLLDFVSKKSFTPFVIYRFVIGAAILAVFIR
jgi:undecaprenyl-diphosphatase